MEWWRKGVTKHSIQVKVKNKFSTSKEVFLSEIATIKNRFPKKRVLVIANKIDAVSTAEKNEITAEIDDILLLSAKEKIGIETIPGIIWESVEGELKYERSYQKKTFQN